MVELTLFDKQLLNLLQTKFPVCSKPFSVLADELNSTEEVIISTIERLKHEGYIRHIGAFFNSDKIGYVGILVALQVDVDCVESVSKYINGYNGVTHNYEREGKFNIWFTLLSQSKEAEQSVLKQIISMSGVKDVLYLRATEKYKINVKFDLK